MLALLLASCSSPDPLSKSPFGDSGGVSETLDTGSTDTGDAEPGEDTATQADSTADTGAEDPCDLSFRAYAEDGHYVDVGVGAMPLVTATGGTTTIESGTAIIGTSFVVTSKMGCGSVKITGVQILIERADGAEIPKSDAYLNELIDVTRDVTESAPSGWYGATYDSLTAPTIGMDWNSVWTGDEIGKFEAYTLGPNDVHEYLVRPNALLSVPAGEYIITYALAWEDLETGTEVWGADLDHATWRVIVK